MAHPRLNKIKILFNRVEVKSTFSGKQTVSGQGQPLQRSAEICMLSRETVSISNDYCRSLVAAERFLCVDLPNLQLMITVYLLPK